MINKEIEEAINLLKEMQDNALIACRCYKTGGTIYRDEKAERKVNAIEIVLNYLENSISKQSVEEKMIIDTNKLNNSTNGILTEMYKTRITFAKELLEGK